MYSDLAQAPAVPAHLRSRGERQLLLREFDVDHDQLREALTAIRRFHYPVEGGFPERGRICILAGDSRSGKTHAVLRYLKSFPPAQGEGGKIFPVVYVETPALGGEHAFLESIADALEIPHSSKTKSYELLNNILRALRNHKVDLLIFDEFQDVFDLKRQQLIKAVRKIFRKILNIKPAPPSILCIGLKETYDAISSDRQLTGRGGLPYKIIGPYEWESVEGREAFRLLCGVIDKALPFECRSGLYATGMAERLYFVTHGSIGRLKDFLFNAGSHAINEDAPSIGLEHLRRAYDEQKKPGVAFNAFVDDLADAPGVDGDKQSPLKKRTTNDLMSKKRSKDD
jgi:hypothetical protein